MMRAGLKKMALPVIPPVCPAPLDDSRNDYTELNDPAVVSGIAERQGASDDELVRSESELEWVASEDIEEAELLMWFAPTGWGLASHVPDSIFGVYGLTGEVPAWDESILRGQFPGTPDLVPLGSFDISQGVQRGRFSIQTEPLKRFLREGAGTGVTLKVVRKTKESDDGGLVHGFASRRHPVLPGPTLAIRVAGAPTRESRESD